MKKNMLAIVILAATLVNIALTALMLFTVIPKAQRTDALIQKIVSIIDLELENPDAADYAEIPFENRENYVLASKATAILAKSANEENSKTTYAQVQITLMLNKKAESYEKLQPLLANYETNIIDMVKTELAQYTSSNVLANKEDIQKKILTQLRTEIGDTDLLIGVLLDITY